MDLYYQTLNMFVYINYHFYLKGLNLTHEEAPQFGDTESQKKKFTEIFASRTQSEWVTMFENLDACVTPILDKSEANSHPHNVNSFMTNSHGLPEPTPAPRLSRTPAETKWRSPPTHVGQHTNEIMFQMGYTAEAVEKLTHDKVVAQADMNAKL